MHRDNNKTICSTQYAHNTHTERTHTNTEQHTENTETNIPSTENTCTTSTQNSAHNYRTYSFDFYHLQQYINKSYTKVVRSSKKVVGYFCVNYSVSEN